jgi:hypothetical protein
MQALLQRSGSELRRMGGRRSSSGELSIWFAARTRTSIMDEGSSSECLTAGSSGGDHACSPSKGRLRARSRALRCFPHDLEDPMRHALSDGSVSQTSVRQTRHIITGSHDEPVDLRSRGGRERLGQRRRWRKRPPQATRACGGVMVGYAGSALPTRLDVPQQWPASRRLLGPA